MTIYLKNILDGVRSIFNFFPDTELPQLKPVGRYRFVPGRTDSEALASDWLAVGNDLRQAMGKIHDEATQKKHS